jgi:hypothetical protein
VFQAGGLVVVVVEIFRRNFLASMVPVIVNAILNEHQLVIDIVTFVSKGDFHRSRLGEKQRGKILAGWVTRKMRTIAQYSIRDPNGAENQIAEEPAGRASTSTFMRGGPGSARDSVRASTFSFAPHMSMQLQSPPPSAQDMAAQANFGTQAEFGGQADFGDQGVPQQYHSNSSLGLTIGTAHDGRDTSDMTPTERRRDLLPQVAGGGPMDYSPLDARGVFDSPVERIGGYDEAQYQQQQPPQLQHQQQQQGFSSVVDVPAILRPGPADEAQYAPTPYQTYQHPEDGEESYSSGDDGAGWQGGGGGGGGLRVANRDSAASNDSWARDALAGMNFIGEPGQAEAGSGSGQGQGRG